MGSVCAAFVLHEVAHAVDLLRQGILCDVRLRLRALERPQRHLGSLAFLADASTHEEILLPIWPDVCHYDGWSPNISARDRVPTVAKSVDFAPRDYRKPTRRACASASRRATRRGWSCPTARCCPDRIYPSS